MALNTCSCPLPTAITDLTTVNCAENFGQIQKVIVQRAGDVFDGTHAETLTAQVITLTGTAYQSYLLEIEVPIYDMVPGQLLGIAISRDATAGNIDDTFAGGVYLIASSASGYFWR